MADATQIETELLAFLRREIFAPDLALTADTDLIGAGFDSMALVRVLLFVETTYGLWIPESELTGATLQNVHGLAATILRLRQNG